MKNISILVVLYNSEFDNSETLQTLLALSKKSRMHDVNLIIWNNGPKEIERNEKELFKQTDISIFYEETLGNESLAKVYNLFIEKYPAQHYVILDDDSKISAQYFEALEHIEHIDIAFPILFFKDTVISPGINKEFVSSVNRQATNQDRVFAYGSGMVLSHYICQVIKDFYQDIFDERFFFYGVDSALCHRIMKLNLTEKISFIEGFNHNEDSESDEVTEVDEITKFRTIEQANCKALFIFHYESRSKRFIKIVKTFLKLPFNRKKREENSHFLKALITGKHYKYRH
jgi:hypothetical protein